MAIVPIARYFNPSVEIQSLATTVRFVDGEGLNIRFDVRRSLESTPDSCDVGIEGLDPIRAQAMGALFAEGITTPLIIKAGYAIRTGLFAGDVRSFTAQQQNGPSLWTIASADDGGDAFSDEVVRIPSTAGFTPAQMIDVAAAAMKLIQSPSVAVVLGTVLPIKQGPFTAVGISKASDLLDAACRTLRCRWYVRDGQLFLALRGQHDLARPAVLIYDQTIMRPPSQDGNGLLHIDVLMDPNIVPGGQVSYLATSFRVEAVQHRGETRSNSPWVSRIIGRAL